MPARADRRYYRQSFDRLYTRQGFDRTRIFVHRDGSSYVGCPCYYCGEPAQTDDHAYPLVALQQIYGLTDLPAPRLLIIVPACAECNSLLSDKVFPSLSSRKRFLKQRLRQRYKRVLAIPNWEPYELRKLDRGLQEYVLVGLAQKEALHERLAW